MKQRKEGKVTKPQWGPLTRVEPEVNQNTPWQDDLIGRGELATNLTNIVRNNNSPLTVALHGEWGSGKTFFLKRWQQELRNSGVRAIYFNAWEDDFTNDPFLSLIGQLTKKEGLTDLGSKRRKVQEAATQFVTGNIEGLLKKHTGLRVPKRRPNLYDRYNKSSNVKTKLKEALQEAAEPGHKKQNDPLVMIVDELDRCRPDYATTMLEQAKHLLDVRGIIFIFGVNKEQIGQCIRRMYGTKNPESYLRKFFQLELTIESAPNSKTIDYLLAEYRIKDIAGQKADKLPDWKNTNLEERLIRNIPWSISKLWPHLGMSLRETDHAVRTLALALNASNPEETILPPLLVTMIPLRLIRTDLYQKAKNRERFAVETVEFLHSKIEELPLITLEGTSRPDLVEESTFLYLAENRSQSVQTRNGLEQTLEAWKKNPHDPPENFSRRSAEGANQIIQGMNTNGERMLMLLEHDNPIDRVINLIELTREQSHHPITFNGLTGRREYLNQ